ncbi:hypothetical protein Nepgr_003689 [Nepenthes gracilis]|uniref:Transmembrane protein n=1 Tax=Nepenthes gracilis TaxID=150966 RepID=A0AAD3RZZ6_NEPGR|nr:hypothetical protein Nepgr_003689 [Nepenthes gracilis]
MVRPIQLHAGDQQFQYVPLAIGMFVALSALLALCAKRTAKISKKDGKNNSVYDLNCAPKSPRPSPMATPKKFLATFSDKAIRSLQNKKSGEESEVEAVEQGFGEGGLWQKNILMGDKCRPLEFSGVIYYDNYGNQVSELPRSPRAAYLPSFPLSPASSPIPNKSSPSVYV